jgi:hypothetical protein
MATSRSSRDRALRSREYWCSCSTLLRSPHHRGGARPSSIPRCPVTSESYVGSPTSRARCTRMRLAQASCTSRESTSATWRHLTSCGCVDIRRTRNGGRGGSSSSIPAARSPARQRGMSPSLSWRSVLWTGGLSHATQARHIPSPRSCAGISPEMLEVNLPLESRLRDPALGAVSALDTNPMKGGREGARSHAAAPS